jgi:hypothetical protein
LSTHLRLGLLSAPLPSGFSTINLHAFLSSHPSHHPRLYYFNNIGEERKS